MPIFVGVDPRYEQATEERRQNQFADILNAISIGQQRREKRALSEAELYFDNPDLLGSEAWNDFAERNGERLGEVVTIGNTLAQQRQARESSLAGVIRGALPQTLEDDPTIPGMMRDSPGNLFDFTGVQPEGIEQGTGPLLPEFWPEAQEPESTRPAGSFLGSNRYAEGVSQLEDRDLIASLEMLKKGGIDLASLGVNINPGALEALSPQVRNLAVAGDDAGAQQAMRYQADLEASPEEQARLTETNRANVSRETQGVSNEAARLAETQRHNRETEAVSWFRAKKTKEGEDEIELDPKKWADSNFSQGETDYDDNGKVVAEGARSSMDRSTWSYIGNRVSRIVNAVPMQEREASADKAREQAEEVYGRMYDETLQFAGGNVAKAKTLAQRAVRLYFNRISVASTKSKTAEEFERAMADAYGSAIGAVVTGVGEQPGEEE